MEPSHYTVAWICAMSFELTAAKAMLDETHHPPQRYVGSDYNTYTFGRVGNHNVVIVCLPTGTIGLSPATEVMTLIKLSFPSIQFALTVGIGGGVPTNKDIRLGDVVVSIPSGRHGAVVQYDFVKRGPKNEIERRGFINNPPKALLSAASEIESRYLAKQGSLEKYFPSSDSYAAFTRKAAGDDRLFDPRYTHAGSARDCRNCDPRRTIKRPPRRLPGPVVHYGTIASGNSLIKDPVERERISDAFGEVLCVEMQSAGLMNTFPSLAIKGISDYADSHKNHSWQSYAAMAAAAYAKELLRVVSAVVPTVQAVKAQPFRNMAHVPLPSSRFEKGDAVIYSVDQNGRVTHEESKIIKKTNRGSDWFYRVDGGQRYRWFHESELNSRLRSR